MRHLTLLACIPTGVEAQTKKILVRGRTDLVARFKKVTPRTRIVPVLEGQLLLNMVDKKKGY